MAGELDIDLDDFEWPEEVWRAVEGDRSALIKLLRSDRRLSRRTRNAIADWIEGKLTRQKIPRGVTPSPAKRARDLILRNMYGGHDPNTKLGRAGYRYDLLRKETREKGLHLKKAGRFNSRNWAEELLRQVAKEEGVSEHALGNYLKRGRALPPDSPSHRTRAPDGKVTIHLDLTRQLLERRREIAREIRRSNKRRKWPKLAG